MQKSWSILFGVVMAAALLLFLVAPFVSGWWLPRDVSSFGYQVDVLFYLILAITGFFFVLTEVLLIYFMYAFAGRTEGQPLVPGEHAAEQPDPDTSFFKRIFKPVTDLIHDQHRLEITWTLIPAVILLFIAFVQIQTWAEIKYQTRMPRPDNVTQQMEVTARQWEWRVRYPSIRRMESWDKNPALAADFAASPHFDDVHRVNEIHVWKGMQENEKVLVHLKTQDVLHSFFLPNLRLKQDALPGKTIPVWFRVVESNAVEVTDPLTNEPRWVEEGYNPATGTWSPDSPIWELACAEYCGTRHSLMRGKLYVHKDKADFLKWLSQAAREENRTSPTVLTTAAR